MTIPPTTGTYYAMRVPDVHLDEFYATLAHGEILLMADVPNKQVSDNRVLCAPPPSSHYPRRGKLDESLWL